MQMNKKKVFALALAVCLLATLSMGSLAWFTDDDSVTNNFFVAGSEDQNPDDIFSVDVWEDNTVEDLPGEGKLQDGVNYESIQPGDTWYKEVNVENTGSYDEYVRVTVKVSDGALLQDVLNKMVELDDLTDFDIDALPVAEMMSYYDYATDELVYIIYYDKALAPDEVMNVFNNVYIPNELTREDAAAMGAEGFYINVVATAVQTANVGDNVIDAFKTVGEYDTAVVSDYNELAQALAENVEKIVLDPTFAWNNKVITIGDDVENVTIDASATDARFTVTGKAVNLTITNINDADSVGISVDLKNALEGTSVSVTDSYLLSASGNSNGNVAIRPGQNAALTVDNCVIASAGGKTYGIYNSGASGALTITNSTFIGHGSWAIQVNSAVNGDLLIDGCTFETPDGVLKVLSGVNGNATFTNNTMIGCLGHDGAGITALVCSSSAKYAPLSATGTVTYAGNTLDGADWAQ